MPEPRQILSGSARNAAAGARFIGKTPGTSQINVTVVLKRKRDIQREDLHQHALLRPHERPTTVLMFPEMQIQIRVSMSE